MPDALPSFFSTACLAGSFIPPRSIRQVRELTRMRVHLQQDRNRVINRIGRLLETANIKLGSVASNIVGKSGRAILNQLAKGSTDSLAMADLALGKLREKLPELVSALNGRTDEHFRWMLAQLLTRLKELDGSLTSIDERLNTEMSQHSDLIQRMSTVPGIDTVSAQAI